MRYFIGEQKRHIDRTACGGESPAASLRGKKRVLVCQNSCSLNGEWDVEVRPTNRGGIAVMLKSIAVVSKGSRKDLKSTHGSA